jgi:hypothetical protein
MPQLITNTSQKPSRAESENEVYHFNTVFLKDIFFGCLTDNVKI